MSGDLKVLPGFREFYPEDRRRRNFIFELWRRWALRYDFEEYDIPTLEPLELFTRKSGEEIVGQLFHFEDQGGRQVALRPELTPSLARMVGGKINSLKRPVKWFNVAENFRYERQQKGRLRSHYQFNADIFGEAGVAAEAEIIALLLDTLKGFGFGPDNLRLRLSDRSLWMLFLKSHGFGEDEAIGILGIIDKMERMDPSELCKQLEPSFGERTDAFLQSVEKLRSQQSLEGLETVLKELMPSAELLEQLSEGIERLRTLMSELEAYGVGEYTHLDLGIVRGLAYYTGVVFEVFLLDAEGKPEGRALAGGGRYDALIEKLGFSSVPAVGFGMGDVVLGDALEERGLMPPLVDAPDIFCIIGGSDERLQALADASRLRQAGYRVRCPMKVIGFGKQFKQAGQCGARVALIYGSEEFAQGLVKLRDLQSGEESTVDRTHLLDALDALI
jgi:histidyl-tRNA synthetase